MSVTAADLIAEISNLLQSNEPLAARILLITQYSEHFAVWYAAHQDVLESGEVTAQAHELLELHNKLITLAEGWLKEAGTELGMHKKKGKGIMAYADILPKRVSRYRTKQG